VKTVVLEDRNDPTRPLLVVVPGPRRIDLRRLQAVAKGRWHLASSAGVEALTGYVAGAVPPVAHDPGIPILVTAEVLQMGTILAGGGDVDAMLRIASEALVRIQPAESVAGVLQIQQ
jgi:prolyl-tRNA editing enzyme YbaK/EbsC (Cys-tRNA(Pro) deacylase)